MRPNFTIMNDKNLTLNTKLIVSTVNIIIVGNENYQVFIALLLMKQFYVITIINETILHHYY